MTASAESRHRGLPSLLSAPLWRTEGALNMKKQQRHLPGQRSSALVGSAEQRIVLHVVDQVSMRPSFTSVLIQADS